MSEKLNVTGRVIFKNTELPAQQIRVELWDNNGEYGLLASNITNSEGTFDLWVVAPIADLILDNTTITPLYKIYKNNALVLEKAVASYGAPLSFSIDDVIYDEKTIDKSDAHTITHVKINGRVASTDHVPAADLKISIYEVGIPESTLVGSANVNWDGNYETTLIFRNVGNSHTFSNRCLEVIGIDDEDNPIVSSGYLFNVSEKMTVNLTVGPEYVASKSELETLVEAIESVANSSDPFASIIDDDIDLTSKQYTDLLAYLANAIDKPTGQLLPLAYARLYSHTITVEVESVEIDLTAMLYSLCKVHGSDINPIARLKEQAIRSTFTLSEEKNYIPALDSEHVDAFVNAVIAYQTERLKSEVVEDGELPITIENIVEAIFGDATDAENFIILYNAMHYVNLDDMWEDYQGEYGETKTKLAKKGFALLPITGYQPELLAHLMSQLSSEDNFSSLAAWSLEDWIDAIENVSTAASRLCVPSYVKGELTDEEEIKELYAQRLKTVVQEHYPTTAIKAKLEGAIGSGLIEDNDIRAQVVAFIANNPEFDFRTSTIHDISAETADLTGISDIEDLKEGIVPFQRLLRVTNGAPDAVVAMKINNIDSASAVVDIPEDEFINAYKSHFGGGPQQAKHAYNTANNIAGAASSSAMGTFAALSFGPISTNNPGPSNTLPGSPPSNPGWPTYSPITDPTTDPTIRSMFGNMDYCCCCHCMSLYSPAAYLTDILNFLKTNNSAAYNELIRRRPDIRFIDLTCENTNTPLPYVDLVNELLEKQLIGSSAPTSFQTQGNAGDLAAHPEHVYKDTGGAYQNYTGFTTVYDNTLANTYYPVNLPFNLALDESRIYLKHLGISRFEAMRMFMPYNPIGINNISAVAHDQLTEFSTYIEYLGLSQTDADIIAGVHTDSSSYWRFYGLPASTINTGHAVLDPANPSLLLTGQWDVVLSDRLDVLLHFAGITYDELLHFLSVRQLNTYWLGSLEVKIVAVSGASADTCDLSKLKLTSNTFSRVTFFLRNLHRYIRLYRTGKLSIQQIDILSLALNITNADIKNLNLVKIGKIVSVAERLNIKPEVLIAWTANLSTNHYFKYDCDKTELLPSVYDGIFRNKSVFNPALELFVPDAVFTSTSSFQDNAAIIANICGISEEEIGLLFNFIKFKLTGLSYLPSGQLSMSQQVSGPNASLRILGYIYIYSQIAKKWKISIGELIVLFNFVSIELIPVEGIISTLDPIPDLDTLLQMEKVLNAVKRSPFSIEEINYLVRNVDRRYVYTPDDLTIQLFYENLRNELKKFPLFDNVGQTMSPQEQSTVLQLVNIVYSGFSKQFSIPTAWVETMISESFTQNSVTPPTDFLGDIIDDSFVSTTFELSSAEVATQIPLPGSAPVLASLHDMYRKFHKVSLVANKLKLKTLEFNYLYIEHHVIDFDFNTLPFEEVNNTVSSPAYNDMFRLMKWIEVRDKMHLVDSEFKSLLEKAENVGSGSYYADWQDVLSNNTTWGDFIPTLLGSTIGSSPTGLLRVIKPDNFQPGNDSSPDLLLSIINIVSLSRRVGLLPETLHKVLLGNLVMEDSDKIIQAAKGKHKDAEWQKIAKPLRGVLREKQRQALVSYTVANPDALNQKIWFTENDLYAFFLIDVSMKPCMLTSRIKQAISSVQLFVDRVLLSQEYTTLGANIALAPNHAKQWERWRKWYRVWEANRKVFLYPENWIEPELRDDKTQFFEELETQILQGDINNENVEKAVSQYLHRLDEISTLEPVATCEADSIVHVVSRTFGTPNKYYYRKLENHLWTPWEHIDIDINSDHVTMIIWNKRPHLFWLTFKEKTSEVLPFLPNWVTSSLFFNNKLNYGLPDGQGVKQKQLEVTINWSEFNNKKWQKHKVGKERMLLKLHYDLEQIIEEKLNHPFFWSYNKEFFDVMTNYKTENLVELIKSRLFLKPEINSTTKFLLLRVYCPSGTYVQDGQDQDSFFSPMDSLDYIHGFIFKDNSKEPELLKDGDDYGAYRIIGPQYTYSQNMRHIEYPLVIDSWKQIHPEWFNNDKPLVLDTYYWGHHSRFFSYFNNYLVTPKWDKIREKYFYIPFLYKTVDGENVYRVVGRSDFYDRPLENQFMYYDSKNVYYVRKGALLEDGGNVLQIDPNFYNLNLSNPQNVPVLSSPVVNDKYFFQTFYHPHSNRFIKEFNENGINSLFNIDLQDQQDTMNFSGNYSPNPNMIHPRYPTNKVDFELGGAYSVYNWELFFHVPMLIAQRLSTNQQFAEARKWFHFVFDPTSTSGAAFPVYTDQKQLFWKFRPFYIQAGFPIQTLNDILILINWQNSAALAQVNTWQNNPFNPHIIARMRILAYMKYVVMKYLDNLIAWGDQLFSRNTIESINEATQLYILAANILGPKPQEIPKRALTSPKSFSQIEGALDAFSNAAVGIESYMPHHSGPVSSGPTGSPTKMFYFCLSPNDKLLAYWDTIADRLFKIRNCMNIQGQVQQLPLFEPPIDPALLVRATAAGIDINSVLNDISNASLPHYRFSYMLQKANELCGDIKGLGSALLSALEKKDAEELALLRSGMELQVLEGILEMKKSQLEEAELNLEALEKTKENVKIRLSYYSSRPYQNDREKEYVKSLRLAGTLQIIQGNLQMAASGLAIIPQLHIGTASGTSFGGQHIVAAIQAASSAVGIAATAASSKGNVSNVLGGYDRRRDDWNFQTESAKKELEGIEKQILATEIRISIAEKDVVNQELEIENNRTTDEFMRSKFTNKELYNWMVTQLSATYFQAYRLTYELAKKAGKCYDHELPFAEKKSYELIQFGYWDSLRKGLLSGEKLQNDLRKLEASYMDENKRELELTKHVSLGILDPEALLQLKDTGTCDIDLPRWLYNLDYPNHCKRRIKSVSISIPCVAGPYTTVACSLTLKHHEIYGEDENLPPLIDGSVSGQYIATSAAQNDSGMFEFNFRDERYLPFEAFGAVSQWTISLMDEIKLRQFDFNTISDVIIHVRYTAQEASPSANKASASKTEILELFDGTSMTLEPLTRFFSLKHEFSTQWFKGFSEVIDNLNTDTVARPMKITLRHDQFPAYCNNREIEIIDVKVFLSPANISIVPEYWVEFDGVGSQMTAVDNMFVHALGATPTLADNNSTTDIEFNIYKDNGSPAVLTEEELNDLFFVVLYKLV